MKKMSMICLFGMLCMTIVANFSYAMTYRIDDNFVGDGWNFWGNGARGNPYPDQQYLHTGSTGLANDVIGEPSKNEIYWMDVNLTDNTMKVDIRTDAYPHTFEGRQIEYGDFFISTNGWTPDSEAWEYAFNVRDNTLYDLRSAGDHILMTEDAEMFPYHAGIVSRGIESGTYRRYQEAWVDSSGLTAIGTGSSWSSDDYYSLSFDMSGMNLTGLVDFGFHWTMTCANDVIEGGLKIPVGTPEPSTLLLLGGGLVGVFGIGRKRLQN